MGIITAELSTHVNAKWPANMCNNECRALDVFECCLFFYIRRGDTGIRAIGPYFSAARITFLTIQEIQYYSRNTVIGETGSKTCKISHRYV